MKWVILQFSSNMFNEADIIVLKTNENIERGTFCPRWKLVAMNVKFFQLVTCYTIQECNTASSEMSVTMDEFQCLRTTYFPAFFFCASFHMKATSSGMWCHVDFHRLFSAMKHFCLQRRYLFTKAHDTTLQMIVSAMRMLNLTNFMISIEQTKYVCASYKFFAMVWMRYQFFWDVTVSHPRRM